MQPTEPLKLSPSYSAITDMALHLYYRIVEQNPKQRYKAILCPLRGGFFLSDFLARRFSLPIEFIYLQSYRGFSSSEFKVHFQPKLESGSRYLLCDDILATGRTTEVISKLYPSVTFDAAYFYVHKQSNLPFETSFFCREIDQKVWVEFPWENESIRF
ncbi:MAG: phosphoribosyltransferase [Leptonema sp. (in: Bacteria)]|nr:phosphoribosyltransferase [Leptonema sp. (in: bacteria)]